MRSGLGLVAPIFIAVCLGVRVGWKRMAWCACYSHAFGPGLPSSSLCACRSWMKMHGTACALLINRAFRSELPSSSLCACQCWMEAHGTVCTTHKLCVQAGTLEATTMARRGVSGRLPCGEVGTEKEGGEGLVPLSCWHPVPFQCRDWFQESCHNRTWAAKLSQHSRHG